MKTSETSKILDLKLQIKKVWEIETKPKDILASTDSTCPSSRSLNISNATMIRRTRQRFAERINDSSNATTVRRTQRQFAEVRPTTSRSPGAPERSNDNYIPIARCSRTQHHLPRWRQQHLDRQALSDATTIRRSDDNYISIARRSRTQRQRHLNRPYFCRPEIHTDLRNCA